MHAAGPHLRVEIWQAVGRNRRGIDEHDRAAVRLALFLRELEEVERPFDVHVVRGDRRELGARREQRGQVKHAVHLELRQDAVEQVRVGDRSGELPPHVRRDLRVERVHVERDDARLALGEAADQRVADFAAGAGDEDNRFAHDHGAIRLVAAWVHSCGGSSDPPVFTASPVAACRARPRSQGPGIPASSGTATRLRRDTSR